ncbi:protein of unknown function [Tepidibacter aestuarii]|nr:protein of unknown function [Tepidibacter aestuarii]
MYTLEKKKDIICITIAKAVYDNEEFVGAVGIDLILDEISK